MEHKKKEAMASLLSSVQSLISHNLWLIQMIAIVHQMPRIDNNHVSDCSAYFATYLFGLIKPVFFYGGTK